VLADFKNGVFTKLITLISIITASEPESELNGPYGDLYTNVTTRKRRAKEWISSVPVPSARSAPARPAFPPTFPRSESPTEFTPIKSSIKQSPIKQSPLRNSKKCSFVEEPSFVEDFIPQSQEIYKTESPIDNQEWRKITKKKISHFSVQEM